MRPLPVIHKVNDEVSLVRASNSGVVALQTYNGVTRPVGFYSTLEEARKDWKVNTDPKRNSVLKRQAIAQIKEENRQQYLSRKRTVLK